jgi:hypothetical protein
MSRRTKPSMMAARVCFYDVPLGFPALRHVATLPLWRHLGIFLRFSVSLRMRTSQAHRCDRGQ